MFCNERKRCHPTCIRVLSWVGSSSVGVSRCVLPACFPSLRRCCLSQRGGGPRPFTPRLRARETQAHVTHSAVSNVQNSIPSGQAEIYVVQVYDAQKTFGTPTVRVGLEGKWVGANQAATYVDLFVSPSEHHFCARWQSRISRLSNLLALYNFPS
jgi:hypothetical protein